MPGHYSTCAGETLINAFSTGDSNWPSGPFAGGHASPLNNFFQRIWYGKVRSPRVPHTQHTLHASLQIRYSALWETACKHIVLHAWQALFRASWRGLLYRHG